MATNDPSPVPRAPGADWNPDRVRRYVSTMGPLIRAYHRAEVHGLARGPRGRAPRPDPGDAPVGDRDGPVAQGTSGHGHDPPGPEKRHSASEVAAACWAGSSGAGCDQQ